MLILMSFIVICNFFIVFPFADSHVITTIDEETLKNYFFQLQNKTSVEFSNTEEIFFKNNSFLFCHKLRQSRIFQIKGKETWVRESSKIVYKISTDRLEQEKNHTVTFGIRNKPVLRIGNRKISNISSLNCIDHYGEFNWYITSGFVLHSAFLFTLSPNFFNILSREIHGHAKKSEIIPKLAAIIDESAELVPDFYYNLELDEMLFNSVKIAADQFDGEERLCHIPEILKIRLCSIAADVLLTDELNRTEFNDSSISPQAYRIRSLNFHVEPTNPENKCQYMELHYRISMVIRHIFLMCFINTENSIQSLFMSLNLLDINEVFVGRIRDPERGDSNLRLFKAPLLLHLKKYNDTITNKVII